MHHETERVAQSEPWAQGDIIQIEWPVGTIGPKLGIVINADCDLAHGKTDGAVAFIPLYAFEEYLSLFWAASHIEEVAKAATQAVLKLADDTDADALHVWLNSASPEAVAEALTKHKGFKKGPAQQLEADLCRLAICLDGENSSIAQFKALCAIAATPEKYARTHIANAKKAMGEGHFFLSDLVDHPSVGFVIRMRRVYTLPEQSVFLSTSSQRSGSGEDRPTAVRIARLSALYRFKVLQLFALQYSRIGLPDDISALSTLAIDDLVMRFTGAQS